MSATLIDAACEFLRSNPEALGLHKVRVDGKMMTAADVADRLSSLREEVRVKALIWAPQCPRGQRVHGRSPAFRGSNFEYCIAHYGGDVGDAIYRWAPPAGAWSEPFQTYEAAKAAAQSDFEKRIRSSLEATPETPAGSVAWLDGDGNFWLTEEAGKKHNATQLFSAPQSGIWLPMRTARKDGTSILVKVRADLVEYTRRDGLGRWAGIQFVARHPGLAEDGFDIGWSVAAPVGHGGFPDDWFEGWTPLTPAAVAAEPADPEKAAEVGEAKPVAGEPVRVTYTNWRGETAEREIRPVRLWFGSTEWHPEPQWFITAKDIGKGVERDFALTGFAAPVPTFSITDEAVERALVAAKMLYSNALGCVHNHHAGDFAAMGLPGWLLDCERDILALESALSAPSNTGEKDDGWRTMESAPRPPVDGPEVENILGWWAGDIVAVVYYGKGGWWPSEFDAAEPWSEPLLWKPIVLPSDATGEAAIESFVARRLPTPPFIGEAKE